MTIRCSSLPAGLECPGVWMPTENPYNPDTPEAREGSALHEIAALLVDRNAPDVAEIAVKWGVDVGDLESLFWLVDRAVEDLRPHMPYGCAEVGLGGKTTHGTTDWFSNAASPTMVDWKMGRVERDPWAQLMGYALACMDEHALPIADDVRFTCIAAYPRLGTREVRRYSAAELEAFRGRVETAVADIGERFSPGDACTFCPRQHVCDARAEYLRSCCDALMPMSDKDRYPVPSDEAFVALGSRVASLERAIRRFRDLERQRLEMGPLDLGNGKALILKATQQDRIDALAAWSVLTEEFTVAELNGILKVGKGAVEKAAAAGAEKGKGAKAKRAIMAKLRAANAVTKEEVLKRATVVVDDLDTTTASR